MEILVSCICIYYFLMILPKHHINKKGSNYDPSTLIVCTLWSSVSDASQSKSTGWTSTYISRLKNMLHSIADHVSQVCSSARCLLTSDSCVLTMYLEYLDCHLKFPIFRIYSVSWSDRRILYWHKTIAFQVIASS